MISGSSFLVIILILANVSMISIGGDKRYQAAAMGFAMTYLTQRVCLNISIVHG